jgi:hypothetical protein
MVKKIRANIFIRKSLTENSLRQNSRLTKTTSTPKVSSINNLDLLNGIS